MKLLLWLVLLLSGSAWGATGPCPVTVGTLTLTVTQPRTSGISPFLAFFDVTTTTDSAALGGANNVIQDVYYAWSFGDPNASGTGKWANGSRPNVNSMNQASGPVAAHLYVLPTAGTTDTTYTVQVWAYDGTNIATCTVSVTAFAPSGSNGFAGANTICAFNATVGSGCPAGAATVTASTLSAAMASFGSGKRVLLKCGNTFTGTYSLAAATLKASIGAYGGCEGTTTSRPILSNTGGSSTLQFFNDAGVGPPTDIRVSDLDFEDGTVTSNAIDNFVHPSGLIGGVQIVLNNLNCNGMKYCYFQNVSTQGGVINSVMTGMGASQGVFFNYAAAVCRNGSTATFCGFGSFNAANYFPVEYNAFIGNSFNGVGVPSSSGIETFRMSACRFCILSNNTIQNASNGGAAVVKIQPSNPSGPTWIGRYLEYMEESDNLFTGTSGSFLVENSPQNASFDERLRFIIFERNFILGTTASKVFISAQNESVRDNVFYVIPSNPAISDYSVQVSSRGNLSGWPTQSIEVYNNTCYARTTQSGCVGFISGDGANAAGNNSFASNNLFFNNAVNNATVNNGGTGNTVSNNTTNGSLDPAITNAGGFTRMLDFKPTANQTGALATVPNYFDASQLSWIGAYTLGAVSAAAPAQ